MADMDVDPPAPKVKKEAKEGKESKQRFEVKKVRWLTTASPMTRTDTHTFLTIQWNAVSLWAWGKSRSCHP